MQMNEDLVRTDLKQDQKAESVVELDLMELFYHLVDKLPQILIVAALCAALMFGWNRFFVPRTYEATSKLYVKSSNSMSLSELQFNSSLAKDFQQVFYNTDIHQKVRDKLKLSYSDRELDRMIKVNNPSDTRILEITVTSKNAREAERMVTAYTEEAQLFIEDIMDTKMPTQFQEPALKGEVSKGTARKTILAFLGGALVMAAIYTVLFITDDRITTSDFIEKRVGITTLGMMPDLDNEDAGESKGVLSFLKRKKNKQ